MAGALGTIREGGVIVLVGILLRFHDERGADILVL